MLLKYFSLASRPDVLKLLDLFYFIAREIQTKVLKINAIFTYPLCTKVYSPK
jgi:hypothetical protein